jgi:hypothetical protein
MSCSCSKSGDCVRLPSTLSAIPEFTPQCRGCDHNPRLAITTPRLRLQLPACDYNSPLAITIPRLRLQFPACDHNPANGSAMPEVGLQSGRFAQKLPIGVAIPRFWPQSQDCELSPGIEDAICRLRIQSAHGLCNYRFVATTTPFPLQNGDWDRHPEIGAKTGGLGLQTSDFGYNCRIAVTFFQPHGQLAGLHII